MAGRKPVLVSYTTLGIIERLSSEIEPAQASARPLCHRRSTSNLLAASPGRMSLAASAVLRRAALNVFRLNTVRAPARTLATAPKKPAAELTFKEAWLSDPATYPIVVIISSP